MYILHLPHMKPYGSARKDQLQLLRNLHGFDKMPQPEKEKEYNFTLAASKAFFNVVRNVKVFSVDSLNRYEESLYGSFKEQLDDSVYDRSLAFGDRYCRVQYWQGLITMAIFSRGENQNTWEAMMPGKWRPTPPDYLDGVEWCWNTMKPMVMDSAAQFKPAQPPLFSLDTTSLFYRSLREVYNIKQKPD